LNNGWLSGLTDLDTESDYVRERIAAYFTDLLSIGFSGFRMDAAKHIQPPSIAAILAKFKRNLGGGELPDDFVTWLEVLLGGEKDLLMCNAGSGYNYGMGLTNDLKAAGLSDGDIYKVKIWQSDYPKEFPTCGWVIPSERFVAELDCHDDQNPGSSSRDMSDKGSVLVREKNVPKHRNFELDLFRRTDGNWQIKLVLSSYTFMNNGAMGIPDGKSDCSACVGVNCNSCSKSMKLSKAHDPNVCGYTCEVNGSWQEGVYTRVHRDYAIIQAMRDWQGLPKVTDPVALGLPSNCGSSTTETFLE
jgi:alpha-amylase